MTHSIPAKYAAHLPDWVINAAADPEDGLHDDYATATYRIVKGVVKITPPDGDADFAEYFYRGRRFERYVHTTNGYYGAWRGSGAIGWHGSLHEVIAKIDAIDAAEAAS